MEATMGWYKFGLTTTLFVCAMSSANKSAAAELPPYLTIAEADIGVSLYKTSNIGNPSSIAQSIDTPNPYYGQLGQPSGFPNLAAAAAGVTGGPLNAFTPFAYASALSTAPEANAGALIQYSFKIISNIQTSIPINIRSIVSQSIGYQAMGLNVDPTIYYGYLGQNSNSSVSLQIQPFGFGNITSLQRICGATFSNCSGVRGDAVIWDNQYRFETNSLYYITLNAAAYGFAPTLLGSTATAVFANSYIDPYFEIDSSVPNAEQYSLQFSAGVQNVAPVSGVPEPTSWMMMVLGFGLLGGAIRRRPSSLRCVQSTELR
jgi:PEP-CTERM motif